MVRNVRGLQGWLDLLEDMSETLKAEVKTALDANAADLCEGIKSAAPVSEFDTHPGQLKDSVHVIDGRHELQRYVVIDAKDAKGEYYAAHVEFGYLTPDGKHVPAHPFAFPVRHLLQRSFNNRIREAVRRATSKKAADV